MEKAERNGGRRKQRLVNATVFSSTPAERQAWARLRELYAGEAGEKLAQTIRDNTRERLFSRVTAKTPVRVKVREIHE